MVLSLKKYIEDKFGPAERQLWVRHNTEKGFQGQYFSPFSPSYHNLELTREAGDLYCISYC